MTVKGNAVSGAEVLAPSDLLRALAEVIEILQPYRSELDEWRKDDLDHATRVLEKYQTWYCVYCGKQLPGPGSGCCKEVGHTTTEEFPL